MPVPQSLLIIRDGVFLHSMELRFWNLIFQKLGEMHEQTPSRGQDCWICETPRSSLETWSDFTFMVNYSMLLVDEEPFD
jgi:hypothetical protein